MVDFWNDANHRVDFFPVAFLRFEQQQHQVGADGEIRSFGRRRRAPQNSADASRTPRWSMSSASPPIAFIFEWSETASTPSPRSMRLAPAFDATTLSRSRALRRISSSGLAGAERRGAIWLVAEADGVGQLERAERPPVSPSHRAIDVVDRIRDLRRDLRGVSQGGGKRRLEKLGDAIRSRKELPHALGQRKRRGGIERRQLDRLPGPILHCLRIERPDIGLAGVVLPALVKAAARLSRRSSRA